MTKRPTTPLAPSPTLSTLSSLSSVTSPDLGLFHHAHSPTPSHSQSRATSASSTASPWKYSSPSSKSLMSVKMEMGADGKLAFGSSMSPSPSPVPTKGKAKASPSTSSVTTTTNAASAPTRKKERQTRIQEHLRIVKPGSPSPSASSSKSSSHSAFTHKLPAVVPPPAPTTAKKVKKAKKQQEVAQKVVIEPEEEGKDEEEVSRAAKKGPELAPALPIVESSSLARGVTLEQEVIGMGEDEVQVRLESKKQDLMTTLASHGINPHPDVLDEALRLMAAEGATELSLEGFLHALSELDGGIESPAPQSSDPKRTPSPPPRPETPGPRTRRRKQKLSVSFSTLESPSTPSEPSTSPSSGKFPSQVDATVAPPPRLTRSAASASHTIADTGSHGLPTTPISFGPSFEVLQVTPIDRRDGRIRAFGPRRSGSLMVAAELQGIGRVALSREVLFEKFGPATAEQAIAAATLAPAALPAFGDSTPTDAPLLEPFTFRPPQRGKEREVTPPVAEAEHDERLGQIRMWLDSPDLTDEDDARDTWSTIPQEWDVELGGLAMEDIVARPLEDFTYAPESDEPNEDVDDEVIPTSQIRVGGKNIRILVQTKRRRALEDEIQANGGDTSVHGEEEEVDESAPRQSNFKGKGHAIDASDDTHCICDRSDEGEAMVQCDHCRVWYHLECLNISSARKLPKEWFCFSCHGLPTPQSSAPPPAKRARFAPRESTPPATPAPSREYQNEPTFVPSTFSPRPRGNFYRGTGHDAVLALSPRQSRRSAPRSPAGQPVPEPVTPQMSHGRSDYAPRSPLSYRNGRSRMLSGVFEDLSTPQGNWADWNGHVFNHASYEQHTVITPLEEDEILPRSWHDMTMTPSRSLSSNANPWGELQTPVTNSRRSRKPSHSNYTPSQDFLTSLNQSHGREEYRGDAQGNGFAQRLFHSPAQPYAVPPSHPYYATPSSPLSKGRNGHRRHSSLSNSFIPPPPSRSAAPPHGLLTFSSPFASPSVRVKQSIHSMPSPEPREQDPSTTKHPIPGSNFYATPYQQYSHSHSQSQSHSQLNQHYHEGSSSPAPPVSSGMTRGASGLGIGFDGGVELDDLLPFGGLAQ